MEITGIKLRKLFDNEPLKAVMSVTFDNCLAVHDVKIINASGRYFVVMPSRKNASGEYKDIVHPINQSFRARLEQQLIDFYLDKAEEKSQSSIFSVN